MIDPNKISWSSNFSDISIAGSDLEILGCTTDSNAATSEMLIEKIDSKKSKVFSFVIINEDQSHKKLSDMMMKAILSSNSDIYHLAFSKYRGIISDGTILHPVLDDIVLNSTCSDKAIMRHFESKASKIYFFIKELNAGFSNDENTIKELIQIRDALK